MSMTPEAVEQHKDDFAVACCRVEAGTILGPANFEDPALFDDLVESGLLNLDGALKIKQVLGSKLTKTIDALNAVTREVVDKVTEADPAPAVPTASGPLPVAAASPAFAGDRMVRLHIAEGKNIQFEFPLGLPVASTAPAALATAPSAAAATAPAKQEEVRRELKNLTYKIKEIKLGKETSIKNGVLTLRKNIVAEAKDQSPLVTDIAVDIITPDKRNIFTNTMMDVCPIATKLEGKLGTGITYELDGVVMLLTGTDVAGFQIADANASDGILEERVKWGRPGCPDHNDIILRIHATIKEGVRMERPGPLAAHKAADYIVQEIREVLKSVPQEEASAVRHYRDVRRHGKPRVVVIKEIMGQGAMHDNLILPVEPAGFYGGRPNVDLGNLPIMLTPNEVRDGGIHALTCITPATKETTRHYWREPVVTAVAEDPEFDLVGVIFIGSPQANTEKFYVSERLGRLVESLDVQGAIVTTEGFGNNHVDFGSHIEQIGQLGVPVVGMSYCGVQGALVTGNKYMDAMIDNSVSKDGVESDILEENTITPEGAAKAVAMLKDKMMGIPINKAKNVWDIEVQNENYEKVKKSHKL
ncbi:MAG: D-proline reductase (dithiol) proprotein PrdA [Deltaproteobacteria bacterium]|jgi:D-proline reductase (dithiol) PrdA|nr:D-proline reductase (dithiol) proprotein PrdA [Deltaproteobacteria bacterium]